MGTSHAGPEGMPFFPSAPAMDVSPNGSGCDAPMGVLPTLRHLSGHPGAGCESHKEVLGAGLAPIRASHDSSDLAPAVPEGFDVISYATPKVRALRARVPRLFARTARGACAS